MNGTYTINNGSKEVYFENNFPDTCVVKIGAEWCEPCKDVEKFLTEKKKEYSFVFLTVDVDENESIMEEYDITILPTFLFFFEGKCNKVQTHDKKLIAMELDRLNTNIINQISDKPTYNFNSKDDDDF